MANVTDFQITEEGPRNAVIKLTGALDSNDVYLRPAVALSMFTSNEINARLVGLRLDLIEFSIGQSLEILLEWQANTPQQIYNLARSGKIFAYGYGGFVPDQLRSGYTGDINLKTAGYSPGTTAVYTIVLELIKLYKA
jgi:hypothetical protein